LNDDLSKEAVGVPVRLPLRREAGRKAIHLLSLSVPLVYALDLLPRQTILAVLSFVTLVLAGLDMLRLRFPLFRRAFFRLFSGMVRRHEHDRPTGSTWLLLAFVISLLVFSRPIAVAVMAYTVLGDGTASLAGKIWGRRSIGRERHAGAGYRTLEGSAACLAACLLVGAAVPGLEGALIVPGALIATAVEAFSGRADDNMTIPLVTGSVLTVLQRALGAVAS
jgi:diacylglycerol kinase (CTP)